MEEGEAMGPREREKLLAKLRELNRLKDALYRELDALLSAPPYGAKTYRELKTIVADKPGAVKRSMRAEWLRWEKKVKDLRKKTAEVGNRIIKLRYKLALDPFGREDPSGD
ncbi:MAG: hypothetical protein P3W93_001075 [Thermus sp.]|nr:hypothetical protein [Thermus sp.]